MTPFFVSSPGKVIIFGEHSAVYNKPAIAASLDLRAFLLAEPSENPDIITLEFPDINLRHSWNKTEIDWAKLEQLVAKTNGKPTPSKQLSPEIVDLLSDHLDDLTQPFQYVACHCFLYLYVHLCGLAVPGMTYCVRLTLPIGAGLGSSAAIAVCLLSAFSILGNHVSRASVDINTHTPHGHKHVDSDFIDAWSFVGETCFHGNPLGIDNAVATHGGAVMYQRQDNPAVPSVRTTMRNFPAIDLLLVNTAVPRLTAALVAEVARVNSTYPKTCGSILEAMGHLANDAYQMMIRPFFGADERRLLRELVNLNHGLLVSLGVSHPSLEQIKRIGDLHQLGATKLTGAGGGGCAFTLLNDDLDAGVVEKAMVEFKENGFEPLRTSLGGKGVGVLYYDDVAPEKRAEVFSVERFARFEHRDEIIAALGVHSLEGWRFW